jgi:hypothetical protein
MKLPFRGVLYDEISAIFDVVRGYPTAIRYGGPNTYWFFIFTPLALSIIYASLVFLVDASLRATRGRHVPLIFTIKFLQFLSTLFFWVLFVPSIDFFISIFECDADTGYHKIVTSMKCWQGDHSFYCALFAMGIILFVSIVMTISFLYNE